ncbi:hypothetical protein ANN_24446 [Periplaneta americana]|uniref:Uncharacterized protein n=1 Tax=Periplaneta americana TaxID=6978 RepID=A0ABQ8S323_PERAM|nr:hypothetical protein ANN_24446 [Periplaneta americana]
MAGLGEGGNEPSGSLKAIFKGFGTRLVRNRFGLRLFMSVPVDSKMSLNCQTVWVFQDLGVLETHGKNSKEHCKDHDKDKNQDHDNTSILQEIKHHNKDYDKYHDMDNDKNYKDQSHEKDY